MISLSTLGDVDLRSAEGHAIGSVLQQPRRFALLVYLAVTGRDRVVLRDTIIAIFWPERREEQARHALSQALHYLRASLGRDVIPGRGEITVDSGGLRCDAVEFLDALDRGDDEEALRLYRGDFLPGFFLDGAPEFERWLEEQRERLRRLAAAAAWRLAEAQERSGNAVGAASWGRRSAGLSVGDEVVARRLMGLLDRLGDRAGALDVYVALARKLAEDYDTEPDEETQRLLAEIRRGSGAVA